MIPQKRRKDDLKKIKKPRSKQMGGDLSSGDLRTWLPSKRLLPAHMANGVDGGDEAEKGESQLRPTGPRVVVPA